MLSQYSVSGIISFLLVIPPMLTEKSILNGKSGDTTSPLWIVSVIVDATLSTLCRIRWYHFPTLNWICYSWCHSQYKNSLLIWMSSSLYCTSLIKLLTSSFHLLFFCTEYFEWLNSSTFHCFRKMSLIDLQFTQKFFWGW